MDFPIGSLTVTKFLKNLKKDLPRRVTHLARIKKSNGYHIEWIVDGDRYSVNTDGVACPYAVNKEYLDVVKLRIEQTLEYGGERD